MNSYPTSMVLSIAIALSGCGGGGGGAAPSNLTSAPGEAAFSSYLQTNHQGTLTATINGHTLTLQYSLIPNSGTTTFDGNAPAYSATRTITLSEAGTQIANAMATDYFLLNPFVPLGSVSSTGSPYSVVTSSNPIPATLTVGDTGVLENDTEFHDSTKTVLDANSTATYTAQSHDSTTLLWCVQTVISDVTAQGTADGLADGTETDCYTVSSNGTANLFSIMLSVSGTTVTFK